MSVKFKGHVTLGLTVVNLVKKWMIERCFCSEFSELREVFILIDVEIPLVDPREIFPQIVFRPGAPWSYLKFKLLTILLYVDCLNQKVM